MGANGVIVVDGGIPWHLPADFAHYRHLTMGHPMIMGRRTYDSIGKPLPGRTTIVVTRQPDWSDEGVQVAGSLSDAMGLAEVLDDEVFIVGGAQIYAEALASGRVDRMSVTRVDVAPEGDTKFPDVYWDDWAEVAREDHPDSTPPFTIVTYTRRD
jgi:dihydrofolate reductase